MRIIKARKISEQTHVYNRHVYTNNKRGGRGINGPALISSILMDGMILRERLGTAELGVAVVSMSKVIGKGHGFRGVAGDLEQRLVMVEAGGVSVQTGIALRFR